MIGAALSYRLNTLRKASSFLGFKSEKEIKKEKAIEYSKRMDAVLKAQMGVALGTAGVTLPLAAGVVANPKFSPEILVSREKLFDPKIRDAVDKLAEASGLDPKTIWYDSNPVLAKWKKWFPWLKKKDFRSPAWGNHMNLGKVEKLSGYKHLVADIYAPGHIMAHEFGHAKGYENVARRWGSKVADKVHIATMVSRKLPGYLTLGVLGAGFSQKDTEKRRELVDRLGILGSVSAIPMLGQEGIASYRGLKALKKVHGKVPFRSKAALGAAFGTYLASAAAPYLTGKAVNKLMDKYEGQ